MRIIVVCLLFINTIVNLQAQEQSPKIFKLAKGDDSTFIYLNDIIWITRRELKFTKEASEKLKEYNSYKKNAKILFLDYKNRWVHIWRINKGDPNLAGSACIFFMNQGAFIEENDIYYCRSYQLFSRAKEAGVPSVRSDN